MKKFERAGGAKYSWKGKKLDSKEETVKCVASLYATKRFSLLRATKKLQISRQKKHGILRTNLLKKAYKAKTILKLMEHQMKTR